MTQTLSRPSSALPRKVASLSNDQYCVLQYTEQQRHDLLLSRRISAPVPPLPPATVVSGNPHALTFSDGWTVTPEGKKTVYRVTEMVPGVLVESEDFVAGFHYGMWSIFYDTEDGETFIDERDVVATFVEGASEALMLQGKDHTPIFNAGFYFGYAYGCTMIGTEQFQRWADGELYTTFS